MQVGTVLEGRSEEARHDQQTVLVELMAHKAAQRTKHRDRRLDHLGLFQKRCSLHKYLWDDVFDPWLLCQILSYVLAILMHTLICVS